MVLRTSRIDWMRWKNDMQVDKKRRLESLLFLYLKSKKKGNQYGKNMKKRPHDFLWRGSQMESKLMPGKEVTQQRTHNSKTFDLGRGAYQTVIYPETVHFKDAEGQWKEIDNRLEEARNEQGEAILRNQSNVLTMEFAKQTGKAPLVCVSNKKGQKIAWNI